MNDKNEEKAVVSQGKSNKKRRFRPRNKNKQENLDQSAQNGEQKASQSVIDNFFLEPFDGGEQHAQNGEQTRLRSKSKDDDDVIEEILIYLRKLNKGRAEK